MPHDSGEQAKCPHCEMEFKGEHGLRVHVHRVHKDKVGPPIRRPKPPPGQLALVPPPAPPPGPPPSTPVNFCPCCGTNIGIVAHALAIAEGVANGRR